MAILTPSTRAANTSTSFPWREVQWNKIQIPLAGFNCRSSRWTPLHSPSQRVSRSLDLCWMYPLFSIDKGAQGPLDPPKCLAMSPAFVCFFHLRFIVEQIIIVTRFMFPRSHKWDVKFRAILSRFIPTSRLRINALTIRPLLRNRVKVKDQKRLR